MEKSNATPLVSIITPSYNQGKFIEKTILSVICQDYDNIQYILADAVSKDETAKILDFYQPHIDTLLIEPDKGQSDALNKGFKLAEGDIIAYLNSDDCYASESVISEVVSLFEQYPEVDVIYGRRNTIDANGNFLYSHPHRAFSRDSIFLSDYIPQECTFWRRGIFEKSGFYVDESFHFAMDYELWLRFLDHGAQFLSVENFFGLFRTYDQQKSIDQWHAVGLPEIARLHKKYLNRHIPEKEMIDLYQEHFFLVHPTKNKQVAQFTQNLWGSFAVLKREAMINAPLDSWSFREYKLKFDKKPFSVMKSQTFNRVAVHEQ